MNSQASTMEMTEATGKGADIYKSFLEHFEKKVYLNLLGTTNGLQGNGRRVDEIIREDLIENDVKAIADAVNLSIIKPWYINNINNDGDLTNMPRFVFKPKRNVKQLLDNVSKLPAGVRIKLDNLAELTGYDLELEEDGASNE